MPAPKRRRERPLAQNREKLQTTTSMSKDPNKIFKVGQTVGLKVIKGHLTGQYVDAVVRTEEKGRYTVFVLDTPRATEAKLASREFKGVPGFVLQERDSSEVSQPSAVPASAPVAADKNAAPVATPEAVPNTETASAAASAQKSESDDTETVKTSSPPSSSPMMTSGIRSSESPPAKAAPVAASRGPSESAAAAASPNTLGGYTLEQVQKMKSKLEKWYRERIKISAALIKVQKQNQEYQTHIDSLSTALDMSYTKVRELSSRRKTFDSEMKAMRAEANAQRKDTVDLRAKLKEQMRKTDEARNEAVMFREKNGELEKRIEQLHVEIDILKKRLEASNRPRGRGMALASPGTSVAARNDSEPRPDEEMQDSRRDAQSNGSRDTVKDDQVERVEQGAPQAGRARSMDQVEAGSMESGTANSQPPGQDGKEAEWNVDARNGSEGKGSGDAPISDRPVKSDSGAASAGDSAEAAVAEVSRVSEQSEPAAETRAGGEKESNKPEKKRRRKRIWSIFRKKQKAKAATVPEGYGEFTMIESEEAKDEYAEALAATNEGRERPGSGQAAAGAERRGSGGDKKPPAQTARKQKAAHSDKPELLKSGFLKIIGEFKSSTKPFEIVRKPASPTYLLAWYNSVKEKRTVFNQNSVELVGDVTATLDDRTIVLVAPNQLGDTSFKVQARKNREAREWFAMIQQCIDK